jgi:hypothetical protein
LRLLCRRSLSEMPFPLTPVSCLLAENRSPAGQNHFYQNVPDRGSGFQRAITLPTLDDILFNRDRHIPGSRGDRSSSKI